MRNRIVTAVKQRFSIRKLSIGAASVLLGTSLYFMGVSAPVVHAATIGETPASSETSSEKSNDPVSVAGQSKYSDVDVNNAIDQYAEKKQDAVNKQEEQAGNKVIIRPSDKQPVTVNTIADRAHQVTKIKNKIDQANQDWKDIRKYKNKVHNNPEILKKGEDSDYFENQSLSVDDEKNSKINNITIKDTKAKKINNITITDTQDKKTKDVDTIAVDGKTRDIGEITKNDDFYGSHITCTSHITTKEKNDMKVNSGNKVIIDLQPGQCRDKDITVTYDNLNNSYYLENINDKTNKIKISKIERTFSDITPGTTIFKSDGYTPKGADGVYDECHGPQLIIYNDPSDGFFYNNITQISVKDFYYDDKGNEIKFNDKNPAWIFVTSLNSNVRGNVERVKAQGAKAEEKIAGSTVTDHSGLWYSDINNNFNKKPDWDNNDEDNRFGFVGTVAFQYQPGMTLQYSVDDWQWGSHWACTQTQVVSSLNQHVIIYDHIKDGVIPVDPEHKDSRVDPKNYTKDVKETIHYKGAGDKTPADHVQNSVWTRTITVDAVTGDIVDDGAYDTAWAIKPGEKSEYDEVATQPIAGYHADQKSVAKTAVTQNDLEYTVTYTENGHIIPVYPDGTPIPNVPNPQYPTDPDDPTKVTPKDVPEIPGYTPKVPTVTPNDPGNDTEVVYTANDVQGSIAYIDDTTNTTMRSDKLTGKFNDKIAYTTKDKIEYYTSQGYKLVSNNFKDENEVFGKDTKDNTFQVHFVHNLIPVDPEHKDSRVDPKNYTKDVKETIHYKGAGDKTPADHVQNSVWTRTITVDAVTGDIVDDGAYDTAWAIKPGEKSEYDEVATQPIAGYHADQKSVAKTAVTQNDLEYTVTYTENGHIIPVYPDGTPIPNVPNPQYPTDPDDPTKVTPKDVPEIPGYTPKVPTVTPNDPGNDTEVVYTANDVQGSIAYIDDTTNTTMRSDKLTGKFNDKIAYTTKDKIEYYTSQGYKLVSNNFKDENEVFGKDTKDNTFQVHFVHNLIPVDPEHKDSRVDPKNYTKDVKETIHYKGAGDKTPADHVQNSVWTRTITVDAVTGDIVDDGAYDTAWAIKPGEKSEYDEVATQPIAGYHADQKSVAKTAVTQNDLEYTVTYTENGHIIPVYPDGTPIPNVPNPQYPTDPDDPTKVTPKDVPEIPGYTPKVPTVTPNDPGNDTEVVYTANDVQGSIAYIDDTTNTTMRSDKLTGKFNDKIAYTTKDKIEYYTSQGYKLVSNNFKDENEVFGKDTKDNTFQVHFVHNLIPVDPEHKDSRVDPKNYTKDVKETIHYKGAGDKTPADHVQNSVWTRTITVDAVTGDIVDDGAYDTAWAIKPGEKSEYDEVATQPIAGYHADQKSVAKTAVTQNDLEYTVTYTENGHIIPVYPDGTPIPNVPNPQYPTDPDDPTKVTPKDVPEIPGYTPKVPTVTPNDPGNDTEVVYTANDVQGSIAYIDDTTNTTMRSDKLTGKFNDKIAYTTKDKIEYYTSQGYKLVSNNFKDENEVFGKDTKDNTFQVHFVHNLIPVDPEHKDSRVDPKNYTKDVKETIHYKGAGDKTPADHVQNSVWTRTITVDAVTGDIVDDGAYDTAWAIKPGEKSEYDEVATQPIAGYHADQKSVAKTAVTQNDLEYTVTYTENGHIIPVYPDGTPIPNVPNPQYPTDPDDPTKVTPKDVPEIPGYTPKVPTVTPNDPGNDTEVVYHKDIKDVTTVVHYVDKDNVNKVILSSGNLTGKEGTQIGYSSKQDLKTLTDEGYVLDKNGYDPDGKIPNFDSKVSVYEITLKHGTTTVTPDNPGHPGQPVDPDNPDGPKYPDGTDEYQVKRTGTQTIHYVGAGDKTPADNKQTFVFTREITFDNVTGKIISVTPWNVQSHTFGNVDTPVIPGYHADKAVAGGETVTPDDLNKVITVTYAPDVKDVTTVVHYIDEDDGNRVIFSSENLTGKEGTQIGYKSANDLKNLTDKGYVVDKNGYDPEGQIPKFDSKVPVYEIKLKHGKVTVTPKNPGKPGKPINSNDPDGPKWPAGTDANSLTKTGTQTIHYVGAGDKTPADNTQTYTFIKSMVIDKVTGKVLDPGSWNIDSHTFGTVKTPVITGYHADKAVAGGETVTPDDLDKVITVTYAPDGNPGNPSDHGDTPSPEPTPEPEPTPNPTPDDQPDSETSSDEHVENVKVKGEHVENVKVKGEHVEHVKAKGEHVEHVKAKGEHVENVKPKGEHVEHVKAKGKLDKTNPKKVAAYKKERKIIKTKIAKQGHTEIAEPKLPQTGEADNSIIGLLGMLLASFAAMFGFDSLHSHDKKHKN
ncbi:mucus binding protein [Lactobacillus amylovorus GRL1118]|uniref:mucin-binding protein n=1 Tax=Lactobacillus amylovorus TaxID=1604 RepID=UPI00020165E6|nr:YSIRK-type signal peptide-containing protein [Lactobacillus amylovorus]AEA32236.1 mucus binding protein [Lactobacillus amylovorus GRL1118]